MTLTPTQMSSSRLSGRIAWNTVTSWVQSVVAGLVAFVIVRLLMDAFGEAGYGLVTLVSSVVAFAEIADMGLRRALSRHLSAQIALRDTARVNELLSSGLACHIGIGAVLMTCCAVFAQPISSLFKIAPELTGDSIVILRWYASLRILLSFISPAYEAVLVGMNRFDVWNTIHIVELLLRGLGVLVLVGLADTGLIGWAAAMLLAQVVGFLLFWVYSHSVWPGLRVRPHSVCGGALRSLFSLGGYTFIYEQAYQLSVRTDPMVLAGFLGTWAAGLYGPAMYAVTAAQLFVGALSRQMHPLATGFHATGQHQQLHGVLVRGTRYTLLMGVLVFTVFVAFARPIVYVWLGPKPQFAITAQAMVLWAVINLFTNAGGTQWHVLLGMNRVRFVVLFQLATAIVNLAASILLVRWMARAGLEQYGVLGVVIPTVVLAPIQRLVITVHVTRSSGLAFWRYCRDAYLGPIGVLLGLAVVAFPIAVVVKPQSLAALLACASVPVAVWPVLCWWIGFDAGDRERFRELASQVQVRLGLRPHVT